MRICIVSENQSTNLGDVALNQSLVRLLQEKCKTLSVNLSYSVVKKCPNTSIKGGRSKSAFKRILKLFIPVKLVAELRWFLLGHREFFRSYVRQHLKDADLVLIGGGQLLKENLSLFSNRIAVVCEEATRQGKPYFFFGVGVDEKVDWYFRWKLRRAIQHASAVVFRDQSSRRVAEAVFPRLLGSSVVPDLCFSGAFHNGYRHEQKQFDLAVNVMSFDLIVKSINHFHGLHFDQTLVRDALIKLIARHTALGHRVVLFTTGSLEDHAEMNKLFHCFESVHTSELHQFHPASLSELNEFLVSVTNVFAMRMHAGIMAYALGCNVVALNWDPKVRGAWAEVSGQALVVEVTDFVSGTFGDMLIQTPVKQHSAAISEVAALDHLIKTTLFETVDRCVASKLVGNNL